MTSHRVVFDASAALAFLRQEPGADRVAAALEGSLLTTVNLVEVLTPYARHGVSPRQIETILAALKSEIVDFDAELAIDAAQMIGATRPAGLSLGDRACLALAKRLGVPALTADRAWATIAEAAGVEIVLIR